MTGTFYLKCMGLPELRAPDGRVVRMRGRKHLALLVYLAVERRAQYSRDELAHLLWAGAPTPEARHSLATAASAIRRALGPEALQGSRELLRLDHSRIRLDVERLERGELFATPELPAIEVDRFLHEFDIREAQEYMLWRDRQHARWLPQIHAALLRLIDHARRTGASRVIGQLADRLLGIDELSEHGTRAKMESLAFAGDRIAALRVFEVWRDRLKADLGAVPSGLLEEMARRLRRRGLERPVADPAPSVQTDPWRDRPFVGRAVEHRQLYEAWESAKEHKPRHVLVEGESGIGKSTLVDRFAMAAALEGALVSRTQCYELERAIPFAAVAALVTGLSDKPGVSATDPAALAEVARVVPKVRERFPGLPAPRDSQGETARLHFAEGILAMLEAAMEEHPVILVVDDFHLADEASLTVLHLLIRRLDAARLVVLLTMRTSELKATSGAARIYGGGEYLRMSRLTLPPLSEAESAELLTGLVPRDREPPTPPERHILLQVARGVPMVLTLLVQDWQRDGRASLALSIRSMTAQVDAGGQANSEGAYQHIVERVLAELDPVTRLVLQAATVFGSRVNDLSLYQVADLPSSQAMMGMTELTQRHILRDSATGLDFVNELVRGLAYSTMPRPLRQALHAAVAQRLLARLASGEESVRGLETAWHLVRGGRAPEAAPHLLRGAREAIHEGAPHEAELALETALQEGKILHGEDRITALLLHAEILQELSLWQTSILALDRLPAETGRSKREEGQLLRIIANHHAHNQDRASHLASLAGLLGLASTAESRLVRCRAVAMAAFMLEHLQDTSGSSQLWGLLSELEPAAATPEETAYILRAKSTLNYLRRDLAASMEDTNRAITLLETSGIANSGYVDLLIGLSALNCAIGRYDRAVEPASRAYRAATRLDNNHLARRAANNLALAAGRTGDYEAQLEWGTTCLNHLRNAPDTYSLLFAGLAIGTAKAMLGSADALEAYHSASRRLEGSDQPWLHQASLLIEADICQMLGRSKRALASARAATSGRNATLHSIGWAGRYVRWKAAVASATASRSEIQQLYAPHISALESYDVIDRLEIACSYLTHCDGMDGVAESMRGTARMILAQMPVAVAHQLQRLGLLPEKKHGRGSN